MLFPKIMGTFRIAFIFSLSSSGSDEATWSGPGRVLSSVKWHS